MQAISLLLLNLISAGQQNTIDLWIAPGSSLEICPSVFLEWIDAVSYQIIGLGQSGQFCVKGQINTQKYPMQMNFALPNNGKISFKISHVDSKISIQGVYSTSDYNNEADL